MKKKVNLITETSHNIQLLERVDENQNRELFVEGVFSTAEVKNANGRRYRKDILEREVAKMMKNISEGVVFGELSHPDSQEIHPERVAIKLESLQWKGNDVWGKAKVIDTPMGNIAKTLIKEGGLGISSRALGTVSNEGYVNDDLSMITYDLVTNASNPGSKFVRGIYEGKTFEVEVDGEEEEEVIEDGILKEDTITEKEAKEEFGNYIISELKNIIKGMKLRESKIGIDTITALKMFFDAGYTSESKIKVAFTELKKLKQPTSGYYMADDVSALIKKLNH